MINSRARFLLPLAALASLGGAQAPAEWKTLVWVSTRATVVKQDGPLRQFRYYIDEAEMDRLRETLDIAEKAAEREAGGALDVQFDLRTDPVGFIREPGQSVDPLVHNFAVRFNEAAFESDDKTFRGPYSSVLVVDPELGAWQPGGELSRRYKPLSVRFGTPLAFMSLLPTSGGEGATSLAQDVLAIWRAQVSQRAGWTSRWNPAADDWARVPASGGLVRPNLGLENPHSVFAPNPTPGPGVFNAPERLESENGPGFKVGVNPGLREGQIQLIDGLNADLTKTPVLEFWVKTRVPDPLELRLDGIGVTLGYTPELAAETPRWVVIPRDDSWSKVRIDLSGLSTAPIQQLSLAIPNAARKGESSQLGLRELSIAGVRFVAKDGTPTDPLNLIPSEWRLMSEIATAPSENLADALKHPSQNVVLAAVGRLLQSSEEVPANFLPRLQELARNPEPILAITAIRVLGKMKAAEPLLYALQVGPFEHCRFAAAQVVGAQKDPATIATLATMLTAREWRSRLVAVEGLSKVTTRETTIILLAMLPDPEAMIRRAICEGVDMTMDLANRRLLFIAVNDPVEEVRIAAYRSLLSNGMGEFKAEAMKGVRDESPHVRARVLQTMGEKPSEAFRRYVLLGLGDRDPRVRISAIQALAKQPGKLTREELESTLADPDAEVKRAAEGLAQARGL